MRGNRFFLKIILLAVGVGALPLVAGAAVPAASTFTTKNLTAIGYSARVVPTDNAVAGQGVFNSDLAFWGTTAVQGTYEGFRLINIADPANPAEIVNWNQCVGGTTTGNQGDVIVWNNIVVRSWNGPAPAGGRLCGGVMTPAGQEGVHVIDISNPASPVALAFVATPCGSHTATGVPDLANGRLLVYNSSSSGNAGCRGIDIIDVPLAAPATAHYLRFEASGEAGPFQVTVDAPSSAAGTYAAAGAAFGPAPTVAGISGAFALANDGAGVSPTDGCEAFTLPAGAIAVVDRGNCDFNVKTQNAQNAGASAVVVVNNVAGTPGTMGGTNAAIVIPSVQVSLADGTTIKAGLPATGRVSAPPIPDRSCHDNNVILGDTLKVACAGGNGLTTWTLDPAEGGSLENPKLLYSRSFTGVTIGHSSGFTWDGNLIVFGHEPGGGSGANCQATSSVVDRTLWFLDADTGDTVGTLLHPRPQTNLENCTWHNYNVVPTNKGYFLVSGNYQSGISVVDFTDPTAAREIAYADPSPLADPNPPVGIELGGDWSSYYYNGYVYESDITRGLLVWDRESEADFKARQDAEGAAFDASQKTAADAFDAEQASAKAAFLAALATREEACRQIADRQEQKKCLQALNQERLAFESAQKQALNAFKTSQRAEASAFEQQQKANREDWRLTGVALKSAKPLTHLNPQTVESTIRLQN